MRPESQTKNNGFDIEQTFTCDWMFINNSQIVMFPHEVQFKELRTALSVIDKIKMKRQTDKAAYSG